MLSRGRSQNSIGSETGCSPVWSPIVIVDVIPQFILPKAVSANFHHSGHHHLLQLNEHFKNAL